MDASPVEGCNLHHDPRVTMQILRVALCSLVAAGWVAAARVAPPPTRPSIEG
jgi:hypothetical protein